MANLFEKIVLGLILVIFLGFNSFFISGEQNSLSSTEPLTQKEISQEQARKIALNIVNGEITEFQEKTINGIPLYEIEVLSNNTETELKIDKRDGNILHLSQEEKDDENDEQISKEDLQKINGIITQQQAIDIALKHVNGRVIGVETERESGLLIYGVEIEADNDVVEIEIDAKTGRIIEVEWGEDD